MAIPPVVYVHEILVLLRGDDQLNEAKLVSAIGTAQFRAATPEEIFAALGAHPRWLQEQTGVGTLLGQCVGVTVPAWAAGPSLALACITMTSPLA